MIDDGFLLATKGFVAINALERFEGLSHGVVIMTCRWGGKGKSRAGDQILIWFFALHFVDVVQGYV